MNLNHLKAAVLALIATGSMSAVAATEAYSENFDSLSAGAYGSNAARTLGGFNGSLITSGAWTEGGSVNIVNDAGVDDSLRLAAAGDQMTFTFTLASSPSVASYNVKFDFDLGGNHAASAASLSTTLGTVVSPLVVGNTDIASQADLPGYSFTGIAAGTYTISLANSARRVSLDNFNLSATSVAAPVPEPETYAMLLAGLGVVGVVARRRQRSA